jgi:hypothetical protein
VRPRGSETRGLSDTKLELVVWAPQMVERGAEEQKNAMRRQRLVVVPVWRQRCRLVELPANMLVEPEHEWELESVMSGRPAAPRDTC